ncbi:MAG: acetyl-CoA decarbonylase/synthase complex subunit gamma [Armatimonadota bacterium]
MALKALDIYKHLPKTNCGKCGNPTCLAFAMQLASKKVSIDKCPDISTEALAALEGASEPPIRLVTIGKGDNAIQVGNETVLFRHDEAFYHQPGIAVRLRDDLSAEALQSTVKTIKALSFERVGQKIAVDMIAVDNVSGTSGSFVAAVNAASKTGLSLILMSKDTDVLAKALEVCGDQRPLLYRADASNWEQIGALAKANQCPLAVDASDLDQAADVTQKLVGIGIQDIILDVTGEGLSATVGALTKVRRLALKKSFRPLGYPCIALPTSTDEDMALAQAATYIAKYAAVVVVDATEPWQVLPLLTIRQNLYTDPRKPVQVEPKLYQVGAATDKSPLLITTNFSLTYYTVEGDVEASRIPCHIGVIDTEGTSVLTAWASEKLTAAKVAKFLNSEEVTSRVSHRKVIIPGYIAVMSGGLEEESGWEISVGPRESSGISKYLKTMWKPE